eukprot:scaffold21612_cov115-Isochrysis_galbana.AAC.10
MGARMTMAHATTDTSSIANGRDSLRFFISAVVSAPAASSRGFSRLLQNAADARVDFETPAGGASRQGRLDDASDRDLSRLCEGRAARRLAARRTARPA